MGGRVPGGGGGHHIVPFAGAVLVPERLARVRGGCDNAPAGPLEFAAERAQAVLAIGAQCSVVAIATRNALRQHRRRHANRAGAMSIAMSPMFGAVTA